MLNKCAIISFANNRGNYYKALDRLEQSLKEVNFSGKFIGYRDEQSIGAPLHVDNPYAFKIYCFAKARAQGFKKIIYVDSAVYAVKNPDVLFEILENNGYLMQEAGHFVVDWCNDETARHYKLTEKEKTEMLMYGNAGFLGLNFDYPIAEQFFFNWNIGMMQGYFKGDWANHRHDMTVGSIIANRMGMKFINGEQILQYGAPEIPIINDSIIFKASGL